MQCTYIFEPPILKMTEHATATATGTHNGDDDNSNTEKQRPNPIAQRNPAESGLGN
jgi:hypothetical protein